MVHPNAFPGKYFNFRMPQSGPVPPATLDRGIAHGATQRVTTHLRDNVNAPHGTPWQFKFLKYVPGAITRTELDGPVLTGPMSGCILATYTKGGRRWIAHIGTYLSATDAETVRAKANWTTYMANGVANVGGGLPGSAFTIEDQLAPAQATGMRPSVWGYITPTYSYALLVYTANNVLGANQIIKSRGLIMRPWANIPGSW